MNSKSKIPKIFLSYSWKESDKRYADSIDSAFQEAGIFFIRDIRAIKYKDNIDEYMLKIRDADFAILMLSENYIKSKNCMYEAIQLLKEKTYLKKVLPVLIDNPQIFFTSKGKIDFITFWKDERDKLKRKLEDVEPQYAINILNDLKILEEIYLNIDFFLGGLSNILNKSFNELIGTKYKDLLEALNLNPYLLYKDFNTKEIFCEVQNEDKNGLHVIIKFKNISKKINLKYKPKKSDWDYEKNELVSDHQYYYTLLDIRKYIFSFTSRESSNIKKEKVLIKAVSDIENEIEFGGINTLTGFLFDWYNNKNKVPSYILFIEAIDYFLQSNGNKNAKYTVQTLGEIILFKTDSQAYIINTYEGKIDELKYFIETKAYSEIYTMTNQGIWSEIFLDSRIPKEEYIPVMQNLWEEFWDELYLSKNKSIGSTKHLDKSKDKSWRQFQVFTDSYNNVSDIIKYAYKLDYTTMYPIAVITMLNIYNQEVCYAEYCEYEFEYGDWESVCVNDEDDLKPVFYIKKDELRNL